MRGIWAAAILVAMSGPVSANTTVGYGGLHDLFASVGGSSNPLFGFEEVIETSTPFSDTRSAQGSGFGPGSNAEITASTRAALVNGRPSLGFSMSTTPLQGNSRGLRARTAVAVFDGLMLAAPQPAASLPPLTFNVQTTVSGTVDVTGLRTGDDGKLGTAVAVTSDRNALVEAMQAAAVSGDVIDTRPGTPVTVANQPLTLTADTTALPEAVWLTTGMPTTFSAFEAAYRDAVARCRQTGGQCLFPGAPVVGPYTVGNVGIGVAFGGQMSAELMGAASVSASNSLDIEGIFATDPEGEVVPMWIAGLSGIDYTLPEHAPDGPSPFPRVQPAPVPLPAPGLLLAACLGMLALCRRRHAG